MSTSALRSRPLGSKFSCRRRRPASFIGGRAIAARTPDTATGQCVGGTPKVAARQTVAAGGDRHAGAAREASLLIGSARDDRHRLRDDIGIARRRCCSRRPRVCRVRHLGWRRRGESDRRRRSAVRTSRWRRRWRSLHSRDRRAGGNRKCRRRIAIISLRVAGYAGGAKLSRAESARRMPDHVAEKGIIVIFAVRYDGERARHPLLQPVSSTSRVIIAAGARLRRKAKIVPTTKRRDGAYYRGHLPHGCTTEWRCGSL